MASELKHMFLWNHKNVFRITRTSWSGEISTRFDIETMKEEYWLRLDFINFEGWCTEAFILAEIKKFEDQSETEVEVNN